jgi:phosphatidylglycerophosphate synthase
LLDRHLLPLIHKPVNVLAAQLVRRGVRADHVTYAAFALGLVAAFLIANSLYFSAALAILASRLCDALDGAVARQTQTTEAGAFLDITLDFLFYASIPLAFAWAGPELNALPAAVLLAAFIGTGASFLAFAALAQKKGLSAEQQSYKSIHFLGGLTEATETLACFMLMCLLPKYFPWLAYGFAGLCVFTIATRLQHGYSLLKS